MESLTPHIAAVMALVDRVRDPGQRCVIGIAGPPGSGKSTLGGAVVHHLNAPGQSAPVAALVPMDGFHLDNVILEARGMRAIKGAPETFDVAAFVALVRALRLDAENIRYPLFDRKADRTVPKAGLVPAQTPIVVVEGNYLLLRTDGWRDLRGVFDATVMIAPPLKTLEARLVDRWLHHGLSRKEALRRVRGNDLPNARRVMEESMAADLVL